MNGFLKKTISLILVMIISVGIITPAGVASVKGATPVEIGYALSADSLFVDDTVNVRFFFKNFAEANIDCSAFQLDVYVDPQIFTVETMKCTLDGTGAMMFSTKFNSGENKIKTIYFNTQSNLPKDSTDICNFTLRLNRNFEKATDVQLNVTLAMVLDINNNRYEVTYSSPVVKCLPSSGRPSVTPSVAPGTADSVIETIPAGTTAPVTTDQPSATEAVDAKEYTVTYIDVNGSIITTEKVKEGQPAKNSEIPYRPGYDFIGWRVNSGSLKKVVSDMSVTAQYKVGENLYTIKVQGGTVNGEYAPLKAKYDDCVVVKLDEVSIPSGTYFAGWKKSGCDKVVSYNKTYSFLVTGSADIVPVFSQTQMIPVPQTILYNCVVNSDGIVFTSENYIPDGYSYSGSGIIVTKDATIGASSDSFVLNGQNTTTYRANKNSFNSQFSLVSYNLADSFYARSYFIYKSEAGEKFTVYSDIKLYDPAIF